MFKPGKPITHLNKAYARGGYVADAEQGDVPRESYYNPLAGRDGEPEGYDTPVGDEPGFPAPQKEKKPERKPGKDFRKQYQPGKGYYNDGDVG